MSGTKSINVRSSLDDNINFAGFHHIGEGKAGIDVLLAYGSTVLENGWHWVKQDRLGMHVSEFHGPFPTAKAAFEAAMNTELADAGSSARG